MTTPQRPISGPSRDTTERLLDVAERMFAARGYSAASVRDITRAADCNVAAVNYHFGSKDALYAAVYRRMFVRVRERRVAAMEEALAVDAPTLEGVLAAFVRSYIEPVPPPAAPVPFLDLMTREVLERRLPGGLLTEELFEPTARALAAALKVVCPGFPARFVRPCAQSVIGQLSIAQRAQRMRSGESTAPELSPRRIEEHVVRFSAAGIRAYAGAGGH